MRGLLMDVSWVEAVKGGRGDGQAIWPVDMPLGRSQVSHVI